MHTAVSHGDAVTDTGNTENKGMTTTCVNTFLNETLEITHAGVARDQIGKGRSDPDEGFVHLLLWNTGSF